MSGDTQWRWADPEGQQRLVRTDELRAALANGMIPPNAPVWQKGWLDWQPAFDVPELTSSALSAQNGVVPNIPPPPLFVVAAQSAFEGSPRPPSVIGEEPPPPPRYVPAPLRPPSPPAAPSSSASLSRPPQSVKTPQRPASNSTRPPISQRMSATEALKRAVPSSASIKSAMPQKPPARPPVASQAPRAPDTQPDVGAQSPAGRPANANPTPRGGLAVPTVMGVPRIADPRLAGGPHRSTDPGGLGGRADHTRPDHTPLMPTAADRKRPDPARSTLLFDGSAPAEPVRTDSPAPPIVAPGSAGAAKNAVTRPPPVDMGVMQMSPGSPRKKEDSSEEISDSTFIEQTDDGPRIAQPSAKPSKPPKPAPPMLSKRPSNPGLRALASGAPSALSRPPAPPMDGYESKGDPTASTATMHGVPVLSSSLSASKPAPPPPPSPVGVAVAPQRGASALSPPTLLGMGAIPSPGPMPADLMAQVKAAERGSQPSFPADAPFIPGARLAWLEPVLVKFPQLRKLQVGKPVFFLPVVGGLAALVALIVFGLLVKGGVSLVSGDEKSARRRGRQAATQSENDTSPSTPTIAPAAATTETPSTTAPESNTGVVCRGTGVGKTLAPKAIVASGIEATAFAKTIGVGFATSPNNGIALELDPSTLNVLNTAKAKGPDLKRVTPLQVGGRLFAAADVDKRFDALVGARTIGATTPFEIGVREGHLAVAPRGGAASKLWPVDLDAPVEAIRGAFDGAGYSIAFRRGASIFTGTLNGQLKAAGSLVETRGFGTQVGSPSVGASGGASLVMWADRSSPDQPWGLRMRRSTATGSDEPVAFAPAGGPGAPFIAPSVVGLTGGRFLVVWTEGPAKSHQVRGATLDASGKIVATPFALSPPTANAGQAQAALGADGRGVVVYLVSSATEGFELAATGVTCAP